MKSIALVVALIGLAAQAGEADLLALEKLNAEEMTHVIFTITDGVEPLPADPHCRVPRGRPHRDEGGEVPYGGGLFAEKLGTGGVKR